MFLNCNEEIKRQKERTIRNQNMLAGRICSRLKDRIRDRIRDRNRGRDRHRGQQLWVSCTFHLRGWGH